MTLAWSPIVQVGDSVSAVYDKHLVQLPGGQWVLGRAYHLPQNLINSGVAFMLSIPILSYSSFSYLCQFQLSI